MDDADPPHQSARLSVDEIRHAIETMTDAQYGRVRKAAHLYAHHPLEPDDLIQEAYARALIGSRTCPRDISIDRFLAEAIRSIAHGEHEKVENRRDEVAVHDDGMDESEAIMLRDPAPNAEEMLDYRGAQNQLLALFDGDEAAQLIVLGVMAGEQGQELREATGLNKTEFNSKRRYVRRKIDRAIEEGWRP